MRRLLWVVEMLVDDDRWEPTVGVGLSREQARQECHRWMEENPADKFRVREYVATSSA
jgi:hypothetical protein